MFFLSSEKVFSWFIGTGYGPLIDAKVEIFHAFRKYAYEEHLLTWECLLLNKEFLLPWRQYSLVSERTLDSLDQICSVSLLKWLFGLLCAEVRGQTQKGARLSAVSPALGGTADADAAHGNT